MKLFMNDSVFKFKVQPNSFSFYYRYNNKVHKQSINQTAYQILKMIAEHNDIETVISKLSRMYNDGTAAIKDKVDSFIKECVDQNLLVTKINNTKISHYGGLNYWSPDFISIEVTNSCPLNCLHCYLGDKNDISISHINCMKICDDIVNLGVDTVQISGGEPFTYPYLDTLINKFNENNIKTIFITSGVIDIKNNNSTIIALNKIIKNEGYIQISIDGLEKTHNNIRQNNLSYNKAISFVEFINKLGITVNAATVVNNTNIDEIESLAKVVKGLGIVNYKLSGVIEIGNAKNNYSIDSKLSNKIVDKINYLKDKYSDNNFKIQAINDINDEKVFKNSVNCGAGTLQITIDPTLNVYPCPLIRKPIFNISKTNLLDGLIKHTPYFAKINAPSIKTCNSCSEIIKCQGCIACGYNNIDNKNCIWKKTVPIGYINSI